MDIIANLLVVFGNPILFVIDKFGTKPLERSHLHVIQTDFRFLHDPYPLHHSMSKYLYHVGCNYVTAVTCSLNHVC